MLTQHIALVPEAEGLDLAELARVSAALQKQVMRDLGPSWGITATVDTFPRLEDVPAGYWPILVTDCDVGLDGGVRMDRDGTPYAQVEMGRDWSLDASRACLEMLVNPFGKRSVSAPSPRSDQGRVEVLIEVCGPCADALCAYAINDVVVSDFCLPAYYEEGPQQPGKRLTFNGSISEPFRVAPGGHLTWFDVVTESHWRRSHWGENPIDTPLGRLTDGASSARELGPRPSARLRPSSPEHEAFHARVEIERQHGQRVSELKALRLRASFLDVPLARALAAAKTPRVLLPQEPREEEPVTAAELTEMPERREPSVPPPLPPRSARPASANPPVGPAWPQGTQSGASKQVGASWPLPGKSSSPSSTASKSWPLPGGAPSARPQVSAAPRSASTPQASMAHAAPAQSVRPTAAAQPAQATAAKSDPPPPAIPSMAPVSVAVAREAQNPGRLPMIVAAAAVLVAIIAIAWGSRNALAPSPTATAAPAPAPVAPALVAPVPTAPAPAAPAPAPAEAAHTPDPAPAAQPTIATPAPAPHHAVPTIEIEGEVTRAAVRKPKREKANAAPAPAEPAPVAIKPAAPTPKTEPVPAQAPAPVAAKPVDPLSIDALIESRR